MSNVELIHRVQSRLAYASEPNVNLPREEVEALLAAVIESPEVGHWPSLRAAAMRHVRATIVRCGGNKHEAAKALGVSLKTIYNWLDREREEQQSVETPQPKHGNSSRTRAMAASGQ